MAENVHIERLNNERLKDVRFLAKEVLKKDHPLSYWEAKYNTSYLGLNHACFLAYNGTQPIAFAGILPMPFRQDDHQIIAAQTCDYVTLSEYRQHGYHRKLLERSLDLLSDAGVPFLFALMSEDSYVAGKRTGFTFRERHLLWNVAVQRIPTDALQRKFGFDNAKRYDRILGDLLAAPGAFQNQHIREGYLGVDYHEDWFRFKSYTPNYVIRLEHGLAWIKPFTDLHIGAVQTEQPEHIVPLVEELKTVAKKLGCRNLIFMTEDDSRYNRFLEKEHTSEPCWHPAILELDSTFSTELLRNNYGDFDTF